MFELWYIYCFLSSEVVVVKAQKKRCGFNLFLSAQAETITEGGLMLSLFLLL